jgi:RNA polymerase sigma-70 factor, ECF subfamily
VSGPGRSGPIKDSGGPDPTDQELVRLTLAGSHAAFATLMQRHERRVYNLAYRMLGTREDARDATQDAFLSCYRHLRRFRGDSAFSTWLHRIAVNASYDLLRRRPAVVALDDELVEPHPAPDHADQAAAATDVQRALMAVPPDFRMALILHEVQDLPLEDIAAALDIPVGTVKSRVHRGRVALARALGARAAREPRDADAPSKPPNQ